MKSEEWLYKRLTNIPSPGVGDLTAIGEIEKHSSEVLALILSNCPENREREIAIARWEECLLWARLAIKRGSDD